MTRLAHNRHGASKGVLPWLRAVRVDGRQPVLSLRLQSGEERALLALARRDAVCYPRSMHPGVANPARSPQERGAQPASPFCAARRGCCAPFVRLLCPLRSAIYDAATGDALSMAGNASVLMPLARIAHTILAFGTAQAYNVDGSSPSGRNGRGPALDLGRWPLDGLWEPQRQPATMERQPATRVKRRR